MVKDSRAVDIVYLWVDGSDPVWRNKRSQAREALADSERAQSAPYGDVEGRFRDNDELRYSLRALDRFFPQHGHVYIVTDGQVPAWLRPHPQLTLIDHRALIPAASLPTFDSCHIESYIHRIPNLAERYFYFNDDVFFGAPVDLEDWFWDEGVYACWSDDAAVAPGPLRRESDSLENACRRSIQWLDAQPQDGLHAGYRHTLQTFAHSPRAMRKSVLFALEAIAPDMFASVRSTVFRNWEKPSIVADFVTRWSLAHAKARVRSYSHAHVASGEAQQASGMERVVRQLGDLHFFCINDTADDAPARDPRLVGIRQTLQSLFAKKSRYELSPSALDEGVLALSV